MTETFTKEQLARFAHIATEKADERAAAEYPEPGPKRDARRGELAMRYYAEYVTPPTRICHGCGRPLTEA